MASICPQCSLFSRRAIQRYTILPATRRTSPKRSLTVRSPQWSSKRPFSQSTSRCRETIRPKLPARASPQREMQQAQARAMLDASQMPDDVGILPQTLISPIQSEKWKWAMVKLRAKSWVADKLSVVIAWWKIKPKVAFERRRAKELALDLHKRMYERLASGNMEGANKEMCMGILASCQARVRERGKDNFMTWRCENTSRPRLLSYKVAMLPVAKGTPADKMSAICQAVVKLDSRQTIQRYTKDSRSGEEQEAGAPVSKEVREYIVIQKMLQRGKMGPWKLWGFGQENNLAEWRDDETKMRRMMRQQAQMIGKQQA